MRGSIGITSTVRGPWYWTIVAPLTVTCTIPMFAFVLIQPPKSGEEISEQIGDRSDPEFESQFLHTGEENDNNSSSNKAGADTDIDALFENF